MKAIARERLSYQLQFFDDLDRVRALGRAGYALQAEDLDYGPAFRAAALHLCRETARYIGLLSLLLSADGDGTSLNDEDSEIATVLVERYPRPAFNRLVDGILEPLLKGSDALLAGVRDAVVDDGGHGDSPSVGSVGGGTSPAGGAGERACSSADVPTVGVPTDASAVLSAAGASVVTQPRVRVWVDDSDVLHAACDECSWRDSSRGLVGKQFEQTLAYHRNLHRTGQLR